MVATGRLALASLAARPGMSTLLGVVFAAAVGVACTALSVDDAASRAWDKAFARSHAAHVRVTASSPEAALAVAAEIPGSAQRSEAWGTAFTQLRIGPRVVALGLIVRPADATIDRPVPVEGEGLGGRGLVLERSFATALGADVGQEVEVGREDGSWAATSVRGIAATVVAGPYPSTAPGRAFTTPEEATALGLPSGRGATVGVRLDDPGAAVDVARHLTGARPGAVVSDWASDRTAALSGAKEFQVILGGFSLLLLGTAASMVVTTLGARVVAERRQLGVLRAAGCSPVQAAGTLAVQYGLVAAAGGAAGAATAAAVVPAAARAAVPPLGVPPGGLQWRAAAAVALVVTVLAACVAALAAARTARRSPATLLTGDVHERPSRLGRWAVRRGASVAIVLGAKDAFARPARAATSAAAVALVVMAAVAALSMEATFDKAAHAADGRSLPAPPPAAGDTAGLPPLSAIAGDEGTVDDAARLRPLVYGLEAVLIATALVTLLVGVVIDVRERRQEQALLKAAGVTPGQLTASRGVAAGLVAAAGAILGLPLGWAFFRAAYAAADGASAEIADASLLAALTVAAAVSGLAAVTSAAGAHRSASGSVLPALAVE